MSRQKPSLLWLVSKWPHPARDGSQLATYSLIRELTAAGVTIDLVVLTADSPQVSIEEIRTSLGLRSIRRVLTPPPARSPSERLRHLFLHCLHSPLVPFTLVRFTRTDIKHDLDLFQHGFFCSTENVLSAGTPQYDWAMAVYEGVHTAGHLLRRGLVQKPLHLPVLYRAQNREMMLWRTRAQSENNWIIKSFLYLQSLLMKRTEDSLVKASFSYAAISEEDMKLFAEAAPQVRGAFVPVSFRFTEPLPPSVSSALHLLFVGKLDWYPNQDALNWFLTEIWPDVIRRRPDSIVTIVGSGRSEWMAKFRGIAGVVLRGFVESLDSVYREAHLAIVPIRYGSGVKVKALEAAKFGRACLMTPSGASGLCFEDGTTGYIAQSAYEWTEILCSISVEDTASIGIAAYHAAQRVYAPEHAVRQFLSLLPEDRTS